MTVDGAQRIDFRVRLPLELRPEAVHDVPSTVAQGYDSVFDLSKKRAKTLTDLVEELRSSSVDHALLHAEYEFGDPADQLNEAVAKTVGEHPDLFSGVGTISFEGFAVRRAVDQVVVARELGLFGVNLQPAFFGMAMDDARLYPVYAKAEELGMFVALHTGVNYGRKYSISNEHPLQLDQVACDFPGLTLIASHGGWPWAADMVAVARRHERVFIEFGGLSPKYVAEAGTGWEVVYRYANSLLAGQILFATDWPVMPTARVVAEWDAVPLKDATRRALMSGNAAGILAACAPHGG